MSAANDQLNLSPHWHVDCRIVQELPEDRVIGTRFLINATIGAVTLAVLMGTVWLCYVNYTTRETIRDWDQRLADRQAEIKEIESLQSAFSREATRIDEAHALLHSPLVLSHFIQQLGRTRPDLMVVDLIERAGNTIIVRGNFRESSERASRLLSSYVQQLRDDPQIGPPFQDIILTSVERLSETDMLRFEITFRFKPEEAP
jgi:hypothetical protein